MIQDQYQLIRRRFVKIIQIVLVRSWSGQLLDDGVDAKLLVEAHLGLGYRALGLDGGGNVRWWLSRVLLFRSDAGRSRLESPTRCLQAQLVEAFGLPIIGRQQPGEWSVRG